MYQYTPIHQRYATIGCPIAPHAISRLQVEDTCNVEALRIQYRTYYLGGSAWNAYAPMLEPRPGQFDRRMRCSYCPWCIRWYYSLPLHTHTVQYCAIHNTQHATEEDPSTPTTHLIPPPLMAAALHETRNQGERQMYRSKQPIRAPDVGRRATHEAVYGCIPRSELRGSTESVRNGDSGPAKPCKLWPLRTVTRHPRHPRHPQGLTS